jgi:hypothetical protein
MADGWGATAGNAALTTLSTTYQWIKLHITGGPGAAGTSNPAGNTTRQQVSSWGTAASGSIASAVTLTWTSVSNSETYTDFTSWTAVTAGTFGISGGVTANPVVAGDTFTIPSGSLTMSLTLAS